MGSVSSLISGRTYQERHCRAASEFTTKSRRSTPATSCFRLQDNTLRSTSSLEQLLAISTQTLPQAQVLPPPLPTKKQPRPGNSAGAGSGTVAGAVGGGGGGTNGNFGHVSNEGVAGDWKDNQALAAVSPCSDSEDQTDNRTLNGNIGGPPPKLIPVSGQLEKNMEKVLIRPTAFKPVVPKNRHSVHYLSPRPGAAVCQRARPASTSCCPLEGPTAPIAQMAMEGAALQVPMVSATPSAEVEMLGAASPAPCRFREELPLQPPYSQQHSSGSGTGGSWNSGRSSSSKSTGSGSLSGRGQPLSDSGSCGHSPPPVEGYETVVRELEEKLRERDLELQQLRENLDENEAAICQVYEEKQRRCEREMEELRQSCSTKMKQTSQKAQRAHQVLQLQVFQLQQEKKKLQEDFSSLLQDRETLERRCATIQREQTQLGPRLEETKWEVCQKSGEISLLKQQLKEIQSELSQKAGDIVVLKAQLREARSELQSSQARSQEAQAAVRTRDFGAGSLRERTPEAGGPSPCVYRDGDEAHLVWGGESDEAKAQRQNAEAVLGLRQQVDRLKAELMYERRTSEEQLSHFDNERRVWHEEKEKVIRYQKQLQQNYIQMYRRNRDLERVMRELSLELESRDMEDYEVHSGSNDIHFEEITATEI
uniref:Leucine zipper, putative tumor suppressor 2a n=1 Tax=Labrus bergylta TaxID=56723 RepID=A0A3Q3ERZ9_9LABR